MGTIAEIHQLRYTKFSQDVPRGPSSRSSPLLHGLRVGCPHHRNYRRGRNDRPYHPYLPTFTVSGVTLDLNGISWTFTNPGFHKDFTTVDKSVTLDEDVSTVTIGHYKSSGTISGLDLSGDGKIQLVLSDKTSHTATYKSTVADTFCPVDDSL